MSDCDLETSVPDWIIEHPETEVLFRQWGIDTSCGGKSLRYLCEQQHLEPLNILEQLTQRLDSAR